MDGLKWFDVSLGATIAKYRLAFISAGGSDTIMYEVDHDKCAVELSVGLKFDVECSSFVENEIDVIGLLFTNKDVNSNKFFLI